MPDTPSNEPTKVGLLTRWSRGLVIAGVLTVLCFAGLAATSDIQQTLGVLRTFEWKWFLVALVLSMGNYLIRGVRWHIYVMRVSKRVPLWENVLVSLAGMIMSITPGKAGEVLKSFMLKWSRGVGIAETAPIVVAERITDLVALVLIGAWGALPLPHGHLLAFAAVALTFGALLLVAFRPLGDALLRRLIRLPVLARKSDRVQSAYTTLVGSMSPGMTAISTALAIVAWFLQVVALVVVAKGVSGVGIDLQGASLIYCAPLILGVASFLPGGIGVTELGMSGLMEAVVPEFSAADSAVLIVLVRIATLWWAVLVGAVALVVHRRYWGRFAKGPGGDVELAQKAAKAD